MKLVGSFFILGVLIGLGVAFYNWWNTSDNVNVRSIIRKSANKCFILYHQEDNDSHKMRYTAYFSITLLSLGGLFLMQKEKYSLNAQIFPAINAGLFAFTVTTITSIFGLYIFPQLIITSEGLWARSNDNVQRFELIKWDNIKRINIYNKLEQASFSSDGNIISNIPSETRKSTYIVLFLKNSDRIKVIGYIRNSGLVTKEKILIYVPSDINIQTG